MKFTLPSAITSRVAHTTLVAQKHSPQVLFGAGLVLMGATVVTACRGTLKLGETLDEIREERSVVLNAADTRPDISVREAKRLNTYVSLKGYASIAKLYLPSIALGVAAVACLTSSHNQLNRRNAGLSAALAATERALDSYRNRIREEYGEERELELWRGEREESVAVLDDEGRVTKSKKKVKTGGGHSQYARIWGRDTTNEWDPEAAYNLAKLRSTQELCTLILNQKGHLFLNEVFDELGLDRTPAGAVVGWLSEKFGGKDGYVDFGILDPEDAGRFLDFVTGREDHIMLDFNVDGEIWRKI